MTPKDRIAVVTKFKLSRLSVYPKFVQLTYLATKQARRSAGIVYVSINPFTLSTLTVWKDRKSMIAYRNSGSHGHAMKNGHKFGQNRSVTWAVSNVPTWKEAKQQLKAAA